MRHELDTVEARWLKVINENTMVAEDFRTRAVANWQKLVHERSRLVRSQRALHKVEAELADARLAMLALKAEMERYIMSYEDGLVQIQARDLKLKKEKKKMAEAQSKMKDVDKAIANALKPST